MITLKRTWWTPHEGHVDLPGDTYLPGLPKYVTVSRARDTVTRDVRLKGVPLVMLAGTYAPKKTRCPVLRRRFADDGLIPLWRPRTYRAIARA